MQSKGTKNMKSKPTSFICKTYKILNKPKYFSIISWSDDGFSFIIKDQHSFTSTILPLYFKHKNFASFNRQLNMYDFHKTREDALEFSHPLFQRNNEGLLKDIHRKTNESPIFKENTLELGTRLKKFQNQQDTMEEMLDELEKQYDKIVEQNQILISELMQSKQREKRIEMYIQKIEEKMKEEKKKDSQPESADVEDFLKLSPLGSDE